MTTTAEVTHSLSPLSNAIVDKAIDNVTRKLIGGARNKNNSQAGSHNPSLKQSISDSLAATSAEDVMQVANRGVAWKEMISKSLSHGISSLASMQYDGQFTVKNGIAEGLHQVPGNPGVYVVFDKNNTAPEAQADTAETDKSTDVSIDVIGNDTDIDGDQLTVTAIDSGSIKGSVVNNSDGTVTYSPNGQFNDLYDGQTATETFSYTVSDGDEEVSAQVTVTINGEGSAPQPPVEPESGGSSGGSMSWLALVLAPFAFFRRRNK